MPSSDHQKSYAVVADQLRQASTFLFVPGNRPDRFQSAARSQADVVIMDLEASVHPLSKGVAREQVSLWLAAHSPGIPTLVRLNRPETPDAMLDLQALATIAGIGLMCSGAEIGPNLDRILKAALGQFPVVLLIETALGVEQANQLATLPGVCRLAFGNMDYATELNLGREGWGLIYPSSRLVVASKCAGLAAPIAGVTASIRDRQAIDRDAKFERSLGFGAKMCIHPEQVPWVHEAFEPSEQELAWARRIIEATAESHAIGLDGEMVDRPVIERARRILARAKTQAD
ncbi:HpcH/HpaI aldolase/citrate lyase family protein [Candidimonas nitroreducens]|uniref:CoA ester lyase n=1 Tax=Candidimonas nitroreducens TaxID=683354 RepID=A0A225MP25_9BURK|nr:CoA ester lyase [Candidimonas nitroreducens]OWT61740.1 CoA ester lyase [Candidimonas nitroreducens]